MIFTQKIGPKSIKIGQNYEFVPCRGRASRFRKLGQFHDINVSKIYPMV